VIAGTDRLRRNRSYARLTAGTLTVVIAIVAACSFGSFAHTHVIPVWAVTFDVAFLAGATYAILDAVGEYAHAFVASWRVEAEAMTTVAAGVLLAALGLTTRLTLGLSRTRAALEVLGGLVALLLMFAAIAFACSPVRHRAARTVTAVLAPTLVLAFLTRPAQTADVQPWAPPADEPLALSAVAVPLLLATVFIGRRRSPASTGKPRGQLLSTLWTHLATPFRTIFADRILQSALPVFFALAAFGFSRDIAVAVPVLAAGVATWCSASRADGQVALTATRAGRPLRRHEVVGASCLVFLAGCAAITAIGGALGSPISSFDDVSGVRGPEATMLTRGGLLGGARDLASSVVGPGGFDARVLNAVDAETGLTGLAGLLLLWAALLWCLHRAVRRTADPADRARAAGLTWFLAAQLLTPLLDLLPLDLPSAGPPLLTAAVFWLMADAIAVGAVLGLSWRNPVYREPPVQKTGSA
jgi:hypothetical protein